MRGASMKASHATAAHFRRQELVVNSEFLGRRLEPRRKTPCPLHQSLQDLGGSGSLDGGSFDFGILWWRTEVA